jgi:hypothetical protein
MLVITPQLCRDLGAARARMLRHMYGEPRKLPEKPNFVPVRRSSAGRVTASLHTSCADGRAEPPPANRSEAGARGRRAPALGARHSKAYSKALSFALTLTTWIGRPSSVLSSSSRLISGSSVLVSTASIMRPPLSNSVQRLVIS